MWKLVIGEAVVRISGLVLVVTIKASLNQDVMYFQLKGRWHSVQAAVARGMAKAVDIYDKDIHVRTLRT